AVRGRGAGGQPGARPLRADQGLGAPPRRVHPGDRRAHPDPEGQAPGHLQEVRRRDRPALRAGRGGAPGGGVLMGVFRLEGGADRLATLTFDDPERKVNVFSRAAFAQLERAVDEVGRREDIGCLVLLSGKSSGFIAGADVLEIARVTDPTEAEAGSRLGQRLFAAWEALPFPTVAAIRGTCLGGGTELALASTYRVVSDGPAVRLGL